MEEMKKHSPFPEAFLDRMQNMLGDEYQAFIDSYENPRTYGLRVNTAKISCEEFEKICPFPIERIPWIENGYFYPEDVKPSHCAFYQAGLYYLQEPSAMTPASRIPIEPGDYVLDLCAAPGGKATEAGSCLRGKGLLVANDISASRVKALLRNVELFGISNVFLTNEAPAKLQKAFPEYFDKIILDAPCSGEGMFRKEDALLRDWTPEKSLELAGIQRELLMQAADMLRPGGLLLYSTCTFAPEEDEGSISWILNERDDLELLNVPGYQGFTEGFPEYGGGDDRMKLCVRIFPHKMNGEGHFLALLRKNGDALKTNSAPRCNPDKNSRKWIEAFLQEIGLKTLAGEPFDFRRVEIRGEKVYYLPPVSSNFRGITFLRNGLYLGDLKKNRFEPGEPLALALHKGDVEGILSLPVNDERVLRYLKGETIFIEPGEATHSKGWLLLCVDGYPLGFGKLVNSTLKNKYPAGWRIMG